MSADQTPAPDKIDPRKAIEPSAPTRSQPGTEFQSLMQKPEGSTPSAPMQGGTSPSPVELAKPIQQNTTPTLTSLRSQTGFLQDSLGTVHDQINTPYLKLKRSQTQLLKGKLGDANMHLDGAVETLGAKAPAAKAPKQGGAMGRLMAYIDNGQAKLGAVQKKLDEMLKSNEEMNPAAMMLVQIKMGQAQQEIEYSSVMLSKVVDALKQLFNIQL